MADSRAWGYIGMDYDSACMEAVKREYLLDFMRKNGYEVMGVSVGHDGDSILEVLKCGLMNQLLASANDNRMDIVLMADLIFGSRLSCCGSGAVNHAAAFDECTRLMEQYQVEMSTESWTPDHSFVFMRIKRPARGL